MSDTYAGGYSQPAYEGGSGGGGGSYPPSSGGSEGSAAPADTSIYVGNLPYSASEDELRQMFSTYGEVTRVSVVMDREMNRPKGFAFVHMADPSLANDAIKALDGTDMSGRSLRVNLSDGGRGGRGGGAVVEAVVGVIAKAVHPTGLTNHVQAEVVGIKEVDAAMTHRLSVMAVGVEAADVAIEEIDMLAEEVMAAVTNTAAREVLLAVALVTMAVEVIVMEEIAAVTATPVAVVARQSSMLQPTVVPVATAVEIKAAHGITQEVATKEATADRRAVEVLPVIKSFSSYCE